MTIRAYLQIVRVKYTTRINKRRFLVGILVVN